MFSWMEGFRLLAPCVAACAASECCSSSSDRDSVDTEECPQGRAWVAYPLVTDGVHDLLTPCSNKVRRAHGRACAVPDA